MTDPPATMSALKMIEVGPLNKLHVSSGHEVPKAGVNAALTAEWHPVLVKVEYAALNPVDHVRPTKGFRIEKEMLPLTLGYDFAGTVAEAAAGAKWRVGDRVWGFAGALCPSCCPFCCASLCAGKCNTTGGGMQALQALARLPNTAAFPATCSPQSRRACRLRPRARSAARASSRARACGTTSASAALSAKTTRAQRLSCGARRRRWASTRRSLPNSQVRACALWCYVRCELSGACSSCSAPRLT